MKLEIDENKVNSLSKEELKEHLNFVEKSIKQLNEHAYNVKERIFALEVAEGRKTLLHSGYAGWLGLRRPFRVLCCNSKN